MVIKNIEVYPPSFTDQNLISEIKKLEGNSYSLFCKSPHNSFQLDSNFDLRAKEILISNGAIDSSFNCQEESMFADFTLSISDKKIVFEAEKSDKEKILYDFLKFHVYITSGADGAVLICPHNWPHAKGTYKLFSLAKERFDLCRKYGMINSSCLDKILLVGFSQTYQGKLWDQNALVLMKESCKKYFSKITKDKVRNNHAGF